MNTIATLSAGILLAFAMNAFGQSTFSQVTNGPIATDQGQFTRAAWADFNGDGWPDLFVTGYGGTNLLYLNNGNGDFSRVTQRDPVQDADWHTGTAVGDYDNNGTPDLLVSAGIGAPRATRNMLYRNNGDATFSRTGGGVITNQLGYYDSCIWLDYDNDGFLDFFVTNDGANESGGRALLFHGNGDATFAKITSGAIVTDVSVGYTAASTDYDGDGYMDILVTDNRSGANNLLYHNNGHGIFERILTNVIATDLWPGGGNGAAWADIDNDGLPDLFVTDQGGVRNRLYHNLGNGAFTNINSDPLLLPPSSGGAYGCSFGDYDNDGWLDLFITGHNGTNGLYHNNGDGTFTRILSEAPAIGGTPGIATDAVAWVDYDRDGSLDLFITRLSQNPVTSNLLFHNNGNSNAWLEVNLVGQASNRSAIGAKVRAHATIGGKTFWQLREISNGGGWNIQPLTAHFGLGDATNVDQVRIEWPSGIVQILTNVAPRQFLTVVEHQLPSPTNAPSFTSVSNSPSGAAQLSVAGPPNLLYVLEASTDLANWTKISISSNATGNCSFTDSHATNYTSRFYRVSIP